LRFQKVIAKSLVASFFWDTVYIIYRTAHRLNIAVFNVPAAAINTGGAQHCTQN